MTIVSLISTKLLSVNAHLFNRVAAHHFKVYICGSRNGIAILDSDKTLVCLRNAVQFLGSLIRQKGRFFSLHTSDPFVYEILSEMSGLIKGSQWRIGYSLSRKNRSIRSENNQIDLGLNKKPDCVLLLDGDRQCSLILQAVRSQIPIVSFVDYTTPLASYQQITYPIPANKNIQLIYQFFNLLAKNTSSNENPMLRSFSSSNKKENNGKCGSCLVELV